MTYFTLYDDAHAANAVEANDPPAGTGLNLGTRFTVSSQVWMTAFRYYRISASYGNSTGGVTCTLYNNAGVPLVSKVHVPTLVGWQEVPLDVVLVVPAGTYTVAQWAGNAYASRGNFPSWPIVRGPITALGGRFLYGSAPAVPTTTPSNSAAYFAGLRVSDIDPATILPEVPPAPPPVTSTMTNQRDLPVLRRQTDFFINENPLTISLIPVIATRSQGVWTTEDGAPRPPQTFKLIAEQQPRPIVTQDGKEELVQFTLLGRYDAAMAVGDHWTDTDGKRYEIRAFAPYNGYEIRGLVDGRG